VITFEYFCDYYIELDLVILLVYVYVYIKWGMLICY